MAYPSCSGNLYENGTAKELMVKDSTELRVQAVGTGSFQLIGKMREGDTPKILSCIRLSDFEIKATITDEEIYATDVTGLYSVSVQNASGFTEVYVKGVG